MIRFNNDYNLTAHPKVLDAISGLGRSSHAGYGDDDICKQAADRIRAAAESPDSDVWFLPGATQTNFIVCSAALRPIQSILCADTGHINSHEAASIEKSGHKILALPNRDGKITAEQIRAEASAYFLHGQPEYLTEPYLVYLSFPTEFGTLYSKAELSAISDVCREFGMLLFVDGARMGYGLASTENDVTLADLAALTDAFYIGGTKCGALFGEALLIRNPEIGRRFKTYMKQNGAVLAKGWLLGVQFDALLKDDTYLTICRRADELAMKIRAAFREKGIPEAVVSPTNQQFVCLTDAQKQTLGARFIFEEMDHCVRFCTSWGTTEDEADALIRAIRAL